LQGVAKSISKELKIEQTRTAVL